MLRSIISSCAGERQLIESPASPKPALLIDRLDPQAAAVDVSPTTAGCLRLGQVGDDDMGVADFRGQRVEPVLAPGDEHHFLAPLRASAARTRRRARPTRR